MEIPPEQEDIQQVWKSCCLICDKTVVLYTTKTLFNAVILGFSMYMVLTNKDPCKDLSFPTGLIGAILGSFAEQGSQHMTRR